MINTKRCLAIAAVASSIAVGLLASPASASPWQSSRSERYFNTGYQDYPTPGGWGGWHSRPYSSCNVARSISC